MPHAVEIMLNLAAAWAAGSLIGLERSYNGRAAGFRTHALVALAGAATMILTLEPELIPGSILGGSTHLDPGRIVQGVVTGVGFIGAGVIFKEGVSVQGLTTAACIWITSVVGMLFGLGMFFSGAVTTAAIMVTLIAFRWVESVAPSRVYALAVFRFQIGAAPSETELRALLGEHDVGFTDVSYRLDDGGDVYEYRGNLRTASPGAFPKLAERLREMTGLIEYELDRISK